MCTFRIACYKYVRKWAQWYIWWYYNRSLPYRKPLKYKSWNEAKMAEALDTSIREAAMQFGVPKSTLDDRVSAT